MSRTLRFTLLGTGSSGGVPRIGNDWGVCDPGEPKNRRLRCSALAELAAADDSEPTRVLIDTAPDIREQLLTAGVGRIDAVIYSHEHADQTGGIDDLRVLAIGQRARIPVHMNTETAKALKQRAAYCFEGVGGYPAILDVQPELRAYTPIAINGPAGQLEILPLQQEHGLIGSLGFRIGNLAYCNDVNGLPEETLRALAGIDVFIIDALRYTAHPSHANVEQALEWARHIGATRTILTNMHVDLDYQTLCQTLPKEAEPGYDGLQVEITL